MTGRARAGPRRGASISRPAAVIFHARAEPAATRTRPQVCSSHSAWVTRSGRSCHGGGAHSGDLTGADGLSVLLVLGGSQRAEHDALLGSHRQRNLATEPAVQRDLGARAVSALDVDPANRARRRSVNDDLLGMLDDVLAPDVISVRAGDADDSTSSLSKYVMCDSESLLATGPPWRSALTNWTLTACPACFVVRTSRNPRH
jgi:hypothetical protein